MIRKMILVAFLLFGAHAKAQNITGKITNLEDKKLIFSWINDFLVYEKDTVLADDKGNFAIMIPFKSAGYFTLRNSAFLSNDMYVWPNATLNIQADGKSRISFYDTQQYLGSAAMINTYLLSTPKSKALEKYHFDSNTYKLPEEKFTKHITNYFKTRDSLKLIYFKDALSRNSDHNLNDFLLTDSVDGVYFKTSVWFSYLGFLEGENKDRFFTTYVKPFAKQDEREIYLSSSRYRYFWNNLISYKLQKILDSLPSELSRSSVPYYQNIPHLIETHLTGKIKQVVASSYLSNIVYFSGTMNEEEAKIAAPAIEKLFVLLNNKKVENQYRRQFKEKETFRLLTKKGQMAKDFTVIDTNGVSYSLKDFKGKIIYIDLWASWCGPCIAEIPDTKKMLAAIKSPEKLAYLSISLDDKKNDWINGLKKNIPPGMQLWSSGGFKSKLAEDYKITGIPHYILIDEHGKLLNYSAPRPSSGTEIINLINAAMKNIKH